MVMEFCRRRTWCLNSCAFCTDPKKTPDSARFEDVTERKKKIMTFTKKKKILCAFHCILNTNPDIFK